MSIANELSGEVAVAILAVKDRSPQELNRLKEMVVDVKAALERIERGARGRRILKTEERARRVTRASDSEH